MRTNFKLGPDEKADARSALVLLAGAGLSLTEAARLALLHRQAKPEALPVVALPDAVREFLANVRKRGRRTGTLEFYDLHLARLIDSPLAARWQRVDRRQLKAWLDGLGIGATSQGMVFRALRAFYRWASRLDPAYVHAVPTEGWAPDESAGDETPQFYSVAETWLILGTLPAALRPALAIQFFAGLRPEEVAPRFADKERIRWSHLLEAEGQSTCDPRQRAVRVPPEVSKTRRPRLIEDLPPTLWSWVGEPLPPPAKLWDKTETALRNTLRAHFARAGVKWIRDGFRHTFTTYALAHTGNAGTVAGWLGHEGSPRLIHTHYAGLASKAEARAFFALRPALP